MIQDGGGMQLNSPVEDFGLWEISRHMAHMNTLQTGSGAKLFVQPMIKAYGMSYSRGLVDVVITAISGG